MKQKFFVFPCVALALSACEITIGPTEDAAADQPVPQTAPEVIAVERIDGEFYKIGTSNELEVLRSSVLKTLSQQQSNVKTAVADGYDIISGNIENYLDWYYGLPDRPTVLVQMAQDGLEQTMDQRLRNELKAGSPFDRLAGELQRIRQLKIVMTSAKQAREGLLTRNRVQEASTRSYNITKEMTSDAITNPSENALRKLDELSFLGHKLRNPTSSYSAEGVASGTVAKASSGVTYRAAPKAVKVAGAVKLAASAGGAAAAAGIAILIGPVTAVTGTAVMALATKFIAQVASNQIPTDLKEVVKRSEYREEIKLPLKQRKDMLLAMVDSSFAAVRGE